MNGLNIHLVVRENRVRKFKQEIELFRTYMKSLTGDLLKQEAALTSLEFINRTAPIQPKQGKEYAGLHIGAKHQGEEAVNRDIRSIFKPTDFMLAGAVDIAYGSLDAFNRWKRRPLPRGANDVIRRIYQSTDVEGAYKAAQRFMSRRDISRGVDNAGVMRSIHERERQIARKRGRITKSGGPSSEIKGPPYRPYFAEANVINKYIKERQRMVGKAKAGWYEVIQRIGTVKLNGKVQRPAGGKVPQWVKRNASGRGFMLARPNKVTITNTLGNVNNIAVDSNTVMEVINARNVRINLNPYHQRELDRAVRLWNQGRIANLT